MPRILTKVFMLVDALVGPTKLDTGMRDFLVAMPFETIIIANKIDKLKPGQVGKSLQNIKKTFPGLKVIPYSSKTDEGKRAVLDELFSA